MTGGEGIRLRDIAHGRSGDKGNHANIGIIAHTSAGFAYLDGVLTAERVSAWFADLKPASVERYALPGIGAYNFLLRDVLGGGASDSLRTDTQGKVLATSLLEMELPRPEDWRAMLPGDAKEGGLG
jgi:hypothetical protein